MFRSGDCLPNRRSAGEDAPTTSNVMGGARARERAVLTLNYVRAVWDLKSAARFAAALSLAVVTLVVIGTVAYAEGAAVGGCIGSEETLNCATRWGEAGDPYVRIVPPPGSEESAVTPRNASIAGSSAASRSLRRIVTASRVIGIPRPAANSEFWISSRPNGSGLPISRCVPDAARAPARHT